MIRDGELSQIWPSVVLAVCFRMHQVRRTSGGTEAASNGLGCTAGKAGYHFPVGQGLFQKSFCRV